MQVYRWSKNNYQTQSLRNFLEQQGFSRLELKRIKYRQGLIFVDHKQRHFNYQLHQPAEILVALPPEVGSKQIKPLPGPVNVLYEDENYLLVNKPAHLASLPAFSKHSPSLANYVKYYLQQTQQANDVIHLVSRLDRDTSGVITFVKNSYAHHLLARQFRTTKILKEYYAFVPGIFQAPSQGTIKEPIAIDPDRPHFRKVSPQGKMAITNYQLVYQYEHYALLKVHLVTGRTHQIRVHLAYLGYPLLGDQAYGGPCDLIKRQALHCRRFRFWDELAQQFRTVEAPFPTDLQELLKSDVR
ncbi:RluA family pseudouridine synthase [Lactobacillus sp. DCY120]|uniref:Pseudouridine synthase n=1 Tax=Bombilactobacillus apium TaxID=2675299 RepID=A0A850RBX2_9LACO|nr:RluA family pseudouridine synthase [Bombilactobacillus apium]NVY96806.1 RluA family pseudouridine synthase [Bombilactobacillus apium]